MNNLEVNNFIYNINRNFIDLPKCFPILDEFYPERWDIVYEKLELKIRIHFPELIIKNSLGLTHPIKDLFVDLVLIRDISKITLRGFRTTITETEKYVGYSHSHLNSFGFNYSKSFCLGSDTELSTAVLNFYEKLKNPEELRFFFLNLNEFVQWESLEGVPYIQMKRLYEINKSLETNYKLNLNFSMIQFLDIFSQILLANLDTKSILNNSKNNLLKIELNSTDLKKLKTLFFHQFKNNYRISLEVIFGIYTENGEFKTIREANNFQSREEKFVDTLLFGYYFKGQKLKITVEKESILHLTVDSTNYQNYELSPYLINIINFKITQLINKQYEQLTRKKYYQLS